MCISLFLACHCHTSSLSLCMYVGLFAMSGLSARYSCLWPDMWSFVSMVWYVILDFAVISPLATMPLPMHNVCNNAYLPMQQCIPAYDNACLCTMPCLWHESLPMQHPKHSFHTQDLFNNVFLPPIRVWPYVLRVCPIIPLLCVVCLLFVCLVLSSSCSCISWWEISMMCTSVTSVI